MLKQWCLSQPEALVLKLRTRGLRSIKRSKTLGLITTRRVSEGSRGTLPSTQKRNPSLTQRVGIVTNAQLLKVSAAAERSSNFAKNALKCIAFSETR